MAILSRMISLILKSGRASNSIGEHTKIPRY